MVHSCFRIFRPAAKRTDSRPRGLTALSLFFLLLSFLSLPSLHAQTRPPIQWMHGGHRDLLSIAALTSDGKTLVTTGLDGTIKIRRTSDGILLRTIYADTTQTYLALSPDGTKIAAGTPDNAPIRIYQISDGALLQSWPSNGIGSLAWSPDGKKVAVGLNGGLGIQLLNAANGALLTTLNGDTDTVFSVGFSPNSALLVSASNDDTVRVWNTANGSLLQTFTESPNFGIAPVFAPDNHTLAYYTGAGAIKIVDTTSGTLLHSFSSSPINSLAFSPDGSVLASGSTDLKVSLWSVANGSLLHSATFGAPPAGIDEVQYVTYTPDGTQLLAVGSRSEFTYYNSADLSVARSLPSEHNVEMTAVGITPDGAHVVTVAENDAFLRVWNASTGAQEQLIPNVGARNYRSLAISPDGTTFATTDTSLALRVWRLSDGAILLDTNIGVEAHNVVWTPDGTHLLYGDFYGSNGNVVSIVNAADGSLVGTLTGLPVQGQGFSVGVTSLAISPDGSLVAAGDDSGPIKVWRLSDSSVVSTLTGHTRRVESLAFFPDNTKLLSGSDDTTAVLWNAIAGTKLNTFANSSNVDAVAVAPDGQSFSAADGSNLRFWATVDYHLFNDFTAEAKAIEPSGLIYSPDNKKLFYVRLDATVVAAANPALNPFQASITFNPASVVGGVSTTGTLTLAQPAPTGGLTFTLNSGSSFATLSASSLFIPAGATTATFTVNTTPLLNAGNTIVTATNSGYATSATLSIQAHLPADFNNAGHNDLVFQSQSTNAVVVWFTNGLNILGGSTVSYLPQPGWQVVGAGDFNRDASSDLVLQNQTTGKVVLWYMQGTTVAGGEELSIQPNAGYKVVGVGDFNGDGLPDLLFQNQTTGQLVIWFLNGAKFVAGVSIPQTVPAGYSVVGTGDLNGDGNIDIVFQNATTGQILVWFMNGDRFNGQQTVASTPQAGWKVKAVIDLNGDGKADLVFQNQTTNQLAVWFLDGATFAGGGQMSLVPLAGYKLVGLH